MADIDCFAMAAAAPAAHHRPTLSNTGQKKANLIRQSKEEVEMTTTAIEWPTATRRDIKA